MATERQRWLRLARGIASQPTAPTFEELPLESLKEFAASRPQLSVSEDPVGNLLVKMDGKKSRRKSPLVMVAHLDHPGFEVLEVSEETVKARFRGGVGRQHVRRGTRVRFFERGERRFTGIGETLSIESEGERLTGARFALISGRAVAGGFAMWDLPAFSLRGDRIVARVCDDLMGAAAILSVLDELVRYPQDNFCVWGLFTRAEEIGFLGAVEAIRRRYIPKTAAVISLECSRALPQTPQGGGVIVRVGDLSSVFDPGLSDALRGVATRLSAGDGSFKFMRALMDGGSCEATPFCDEGYRASGLAIPLGNYHNQAFGRDGTPTVGAENVHVDDFVREVTLLLELARKPENLTPRRGRTDRMKRLFETARRELKPLSTKG